ncbi:MAG: methyltransferase domain-containing protein [Actinomycetota bacterium]|nr:MAG: methyltransferase domain-containing protein [Actinomycetota bacterium]
MSGVSGDSADGVAGEAANAVSSDGASAVSGDAAAAVAGYGAALRRASYTVDGIRQLIGADADTALAAGRVGPARRALSAPDVSGEPAAVLARLFLLGDPVPVPVARAVLGDLAAAVGLGLVAIDGEIVRAPVDVTPYAEDGADWWVVSDRGDPAAADHVLGVGGASLSLAGLTPRRPAGSALDVGTGCGVQALHLSRHCRRVVGTDTNPRALRLAALTAGLSGVPLQLRHGSLLAPVAGERYDLVVSNPPFVISPGQVYRYRDSGLPLDSLAPTLLRALPDHLHDGGHAVVLANWLHVRGQDWRDRVAQWVDGIGCDAWVAQREVQDLPSYVELWLGDAGRQAGAAHEHQYDEWLAALTAAGAEGVGFGWVVLRASGRADPWVEVQDVRTAPRQPRGDEVLDRLAWHDRLGAADAASLLASPLRWSGPVRIRREYAVLDQQASATVELPAAVDRWDGWQAPIGVAVEVLDVIDHITTHGVPLADAIDARVAATAGEPAAADPDELLAACLISARELIDAGLLVPAAPPIPG